MKLRKIPAVVCTSLLPNLVGLSPGFFYSDKAAEYTKMVKFRSTAMIIFVGCYYLWKSCIRYSIAQIDSMAQVIRSVFWCKVSSAKNTVNYVGEGAMTMFNYTVLE